LRCDGVLGRPNNDMSNIKICSVFVWLLCPQDPVKKSFAWSNGDGVYVGEIRDKSLYTGILGSHGNGGAESKLSCLGASKGFPTMTCRFEPFL
jgi:hypothetical protein